jgi:hypothetical protein
MMMLPGDFADLEPYAHKWARASEAERWDERLASTMDELQAFYDAILPRVEPALAYLDRMPLDELPEADVNLLRMIYSFVLISFSVELWRQPAVPDTGATSYDRISEPLP